jgi:transposase
MDARVKTGSRKGRLNYPAAFKMQLAVAACEPGVSVSKLALTHQLNANMVFKWRRQYRAGLLGDSTGQPAVLLPVEVIARQAPRSAVPAIPTTPQHRIEIVIADAVVRIHGAVDAVLLRTVIGSLRA